MKPIGALPEILVDSQHPQLVELRLRVPDRCGARLDGLPGVGTANHRSPLDRLVHRPAQVFHAGDAMVVEEQLPLRWGNHEFSWLGSNGSWTGNQQAAGTPHNTDQQQTDKQSFHGSTWGIRRECNSARL